MTRPAAFHPAAVSSPSPAAQSRRRLPRRGPGPLSRTPLGRLALPLLLLLALLPGTPAAAAEARTPRIGLVLSGGGARGIAHLGVLKVLEEMRVPIHAIAGTSMGAIVGGFYAAGRSPAEIEALVNSVAWNEAFQDRPPLEDLSFRRKEDSANHLIRFDTGIHNGKVTVPLGLIQGQNLQFILKSRLLHTTEVEHFDRLRIPFRAVAADIETGEAVVLDRGELATAIRASMSIPGLFAPVEWNGRLLVDGGIADNLPAEVVRALGADILIAVNVGTLRRPREKLTSAMAITAQVMTIMIQKNTDEQIATLKGADLLITPPLGEIGSSDFDKAPEAIAAGERAARGALARLAALSVQPLDYDRWLAGHRHLPTPPPLVASLAIENRSPIGDEVIRAQIDTRTGQPLDLETLSRDLKRIYSIDTFEKADFHLRRERLGEAGLVIETKEKSWGPHYLRFGMSLVDDLRGGAGYNLSASLTSTALNRLGAEWVNQFQIGETPHFSSEFYQPIEPSLRYFIAPKVEYKSWNLNRFSANGERTRQYRVTTYEGGIDLGRQLENWGQIRFGIRRGFGSLDVRIGAPEAERRFSSGYLLAAFTYNRLDNFNFPRKGSVLEATLLFPREELGSEFTGKGLLWNGVTALTYDRHTLLAGLAVQSALDDDAPLQNTYSLGGFLNLSGYAADELTGQHTGLGRLIYYYRIGSAGLGNFHTPLYAGGSLEAGNVWDRRADISAGTLIWAGSLLIGAETYLGPLYLSYGMAEGGHRSLYLYLGQKF